MLFEAFLVQEIESYTYFFDRDRFFMENWISTENFFRDRKFSQNCSKVNFQWYSAKTKFRPRFRFLKKSWIFDEFFLKIQKSTKIALKSISIGIEQFRAIFGSIKPLRVINNRSELLNAVLNHLKPFKDLLEPFRVL